jgi:hypothetical protein
VQNLALAGAGSGSGAAVGASIAVNVLTIKTEAFVASGTQTSETSHVDASGAIFVTATASLAPQTLPAIPLLGELELSSAAAGGAVSGGSTAVGGGVVVDVVLLQTRAYLGAGIQVNQSATTHAGPSQTLTIEAVDHTSILNGTGGLGGSTSGAGVGIALVVVVLTKDTAATIGAGAAVTTAHGITVRAITSEQLFLVAASVGLSAGSAGISGSIAVAVLLTDTSATIGNGATVKTGGNLLVAATNNADGKDDIELYTGGLAFGSSAGVGVASSVLVRTNDVAATIGTDAVIEAKGATGLTIRAEQYLDLNSVAVGGGGGGTAGVAGSATVNVLLHTTEALVGAGTTINEDNSDATAGQSIALLAVDELDYLGIAGALAIGGTAGVGVGVDVLVLTKDTTAGLGTGVVANVLGDITIDARSRENVLSISAGAAVGGTAAVTVNAGVSVLDLTTAAYIGNDAVVHATGSIRVAADQATDLSIVAGNLSVSGTASVGAAVAVPVVIKSTTAWIGTDADVTALGQGDGLLVRTGSFTVTTTDPRFDPKTAVTGNTIELGYHHGFVGGELVTYYAGGGTPIGGLVDGGVYYVRRVSDTAIQLYVLERPIPLGTPPATPSDHTFQKEGGSARTLASLDGDTITFTGTHGWVTGDAVTYTRSGSGPDLRGLNDGGTYYVVVVSATSVKLALAPHDAAPVDSGEVTIGLTTTSTTGRAHRVVPTLAAVVPGQNDRSFDPALDVTGNTIKLPYELDVETGDVVTYRSGGGKPIGGLEDGGTYYVSKVTGGIQLRATPDGPVITLNRSVATGTDHSIVPDGEVPQPAASDVTGIRNVTADTTTFHGLAVTATTRDDIVTIGISGGGAGTVAVNLGGAVNIVTATTSATIGAGATINGDLTGAHDEQSVLVAAGHVLRELSVGGALAVSGVVSAAPGVTVHVITLDTRASIADGAHVSAHRDVLVLANGRESLVSVAAGAAASGTVAVGGAVAVTLLDVTTWAHIGAAATSLAAGPVVHAGRLVLVEARDHTTGDVVAGSLGIGIGAVGIGASVGVTSIVKDTQAFIGPFATIDALANGEGGAEVLSGTQVGSDFGARSGFRGVAVQARSSERLLSVAVSGAGGMWAGVAGGVSIELLTSTTRAWIGADSRINYQDGNWWDAHYTQSVNVSAANAAKVLAVGGGVAGGFVGAGGGADVGILKNSTTASIGDRAWVYALRDVDVNALAAVDVTSIAMSVGGGVVGVSGSISVWAIGTGAKTTYSDIEYDEDGNPVGDPTDKDALTMDDPEEAGSIQGMGDGAATGWKGILDGISSGDGDETDQRIAGAQGQANSRIDEATPSGSLVSDAVSSTTLPDGTVARIGAGAVIWAGGSIAVRATDDVEFLVVAGSVQGGLVAVGGSIAIVTIADNVDASIGDNATLTAGQTILVRASHTSDIEGWAFVGQGGLVALGAQVIVIVDTSSQSARVEDGVTIVRAGDGLEVTAIADRRVVGNATGVSIGGVAGGLASSIVVVGGTTQATLGTVKVGLTGTVRDVRVLAQSTIHAVANTLGVGAGIGAAVNGAVAVVTVNPTVKATIAAGARITVTRDLLLTAVAATLGRAQALGVAIGGGFALGASVGVAVVSPTITAWLATNGLLQVGRNLIVQARHDHGPMSPLAGYGAEAKVAGASGGLGVAITGAVAVAKVAAVTEAILETVGSAAKVVVGGLFDIIALAAGVANANVVGLSLGAAAFGASVAVSTSNGSTKARAGGNGTTLVGELRIVASSADKALASTVAGAGGIVAGSGSVSVANATPTTEAYLVAGTTVHGRFVERLSVPTGAALPGDGETFDLFELLPAPKLHRWNGTTWVQVLTGVVDELPADGASLPAGSYLYLPTATGSYQAGFYLWTPGTPTGSWILQTVSDGYALPTTGTTDALFHLLGGYGTVHVWNGLFWDPLTVPQVTTLPTSPDAPTIVRLTQRDGAFAAGLYTVAPGAVTISATAAPTAVATAYGINGGLAAVGVSWGEANVEATVQAYVGAGSTITAGSLDVTAAHGRVGAYTSSAEAFAAAGGLVGVNATVTEATSSSVVRSYLGANTTATIRGPTTITASVDSRQQALSSNVAVGFVGAGAAFAKAESTSIIESYLGNGVSLTGHSLTVTAVGVEDGYAETTVGSGGVVAGAAARPESYNTSQTTASLGAPGSATAVTVDLTGGGSGAFRLSADHTARVNTRVKTLSVGLLSGSGADSDVAVTSTVKALVGPSSTVTARDIALEATNRVDKPWLRDGADIVDNIKGTTGGLVSGAGADSDTLISLTTLVEVGANAKLEVVGTISDDPLLRLHARNVIHAMDRVTFTTGGALAGAFADATIRTVKDEAKVVIGTNATLLSPGAIDISARSGGEVRVLVSAETYGAGTLLLGDALVDLRPVNTIEVRSGAYLRAYGDLNLSAGRGKEPSLVASADPYTLEARWDGFAGSLIPLDKVDATAILIVRNTIDVKSGAHLATARQANLYAMDLAIAEITGQAKAVSWVSGLTDAIGSALGGTEEIRARFFAKALGIVQIDGHVETGITRNVTLILTGFTRVGDDFTIQYTVQPAGGATFTTTLRTLESELVRQLSLARQALATYGPTNTTLAAFYQSEITRIEAELLALNLAAMESGDVVPQRREVMTVIVDPIWAQAGIIDIRADQLQGTGTLTAPKDTSVTIENRTPAFLELLGITIPNLNGGVWFNGSLLPDTSSVALNAAINTVNATNATSDNALVLKGVDTSVVAGVANFTLSASGTRDPQISVSNTANVTGTDFPWPDITVLGPAAGGRGIFNDGGDVLLETLSTGRGSIVINGTVRAENLTVIAGGDVVVKGLSVYEVRGAPAAIVSPATKWFYGAGLDMAAGVTCAFGTFPLGFSCSNISYYTPTQQASLLAAGSLQMKSSFTSATETPKLPYSLYGDRIHIEAEYININGIVQSGRDAYTLSLGPAALAEAAQLSVNRSGLVHLPTTSRNNPGFAVYWDVAQQRFVVDELKVSGGYIELFGHVLSTGAGEIKVLGGYGEITVNNTTTADLVLRRLDVSQRGGGTLLIVDKAGGSPDVGTKATVSSGIPYVTLYQWTPTGLFVTTNNGTNEVSTTIVGYTSTYDPAATWRYGWSTVVVQDVVKYKYEEKESWLGFIPVDYTIDQWDSIVVQGQPTYGGSGPYYYRVTTDPTLANAAYTYEYRKITDYEGPLTCVDCYSYWTWYLSKVYVYNWEQVEGQTVTHTHSVNAHLPITITFIGKSEGKIDVTSTGSIWLSGSLLNPTGTTTLTSTSGAIRTLGDGIVTGRRVVLEAATGIGTAISPILVTIADGTYPSLRAVTADGDIHIVAVSGDLPIHEVVATSGGTVTLRAAGAITVARQNASTFYEGLVKGGRIRLYADGGGIGQGTTRPLVVDSGVLPAGAPTISVPLDVIVRATGDVYLREKAGDLWLYELHTTGSAWIHVPHGSLFDANTTQVRDERTYAQLRDGLWSALQLTEGTGALAKIEETIAAFAANRQNEYRSYWLFRATQTDLGTYDPDHVITLSTEERAAYEAFFATQGLTEAEIAAAITTLETSRTVQYHLLHDQWDAYFTGRGETLPASYDPAFLYTLTASEDAQLRAGIKVWTEEELLRLFGAGLFKPVTDTQVLIEDPNIVATSVTILVQTDVGRTDGRLIIDLTREDFALTDDERVALAAAERSDITFLTGAIETVNVSFDATMRTITRSSGVWTGLAAGMHIKVWGPTANATEGAAYYTIASVDGATLTLVAGPELFSEGGITVEIVPIALDPLFAADGTVTLAHHRGRPHLQRLDHHPRLPRTQHRQLGHRRVPGRPPRAHLRQHRQRHRGPAHLHRDCRHRVPSDALRQRPARRRGGGRERHGDPRPAARCDRHRDRAQRRREPDGDRQHLGHRGRRGPARLRAGPPNRHHRRRRRRALAYAHEHLRCAVERRPRCHRDRTRPRGVHGHHPRRGRRQPLPGHDPHRWLGDGAGHRRHPPARRRGPRPPPARDHLLRRRRRPARGGRLDPRPRQHRLHQHPRPQDRARRRRRHRRRREPRRRRHPGDRDGGRGGQRQHLARRGRGEPADPLRPGTDRRRRPPGPAVDHRRGRRRRGPRRPVVFDRRRGGTGQPAARRRLRPQHHPAVHGRHDRRARQRTRHPDLTQHHRIAHLLEQPRQHLPHPAARSPPAAHRADHRRHLHRVHHRPQRRHPRRQPGAGGVQRPVRQAVAVRQRRHRQARCQDPDRGRLHRGHLHHRQRLHPQPRRRRDRRRGRQRRRHDLQRHRRGRRRLLRRHQPHHGVRVGQGRRRHRHHLHGHRRQRRHHRARWPAAGRRSLDPDPLRRQHHHPDRRRTVGGPAHRAARRPREGGHRCRLHRDRRSGDAHRRELGRDDRDRAHRPDTVRWSAPGARSRWTGDITVDDSELDR